MLPINDILVEPAKNIWQTPATIPPTYKRLTKNITSPVRTWISSLPNLHQTLVVEAVNQCRKQYQHRSNPQDKVKKRPSVFCCKIYSSATLQFQVSNYSALLVKYDHNNYTKMTEFINNIQRTRKSNSDPSLMKTSRGQNRAPGISRCGKHSCKINSHHSCYAQGILATLLRSTKGVAVHSGRSPL